MVFRLASANARRNLRKSLRREGGLACHRIGLIRYEKLGATACRISAGATPMQKRRRLLAGPGYTAVVLLSLWMSAVES